MNRSFLALLALAVGTAAAQAHFVYIVPAKDGKTAKVVFSDSLEADDAVSIDKIAPLNLTGRTAEVKDTAVELKKGEHCLNATIAGEPKVVFGSVNYGLSTKGDRPYLLVYHPKVVFAGCDEKIATLGEKAPVELVPVIAAGSLRFKVLVAGKPAAAVEVNILKPDGEKAKLKSESDGLTAKLDGVGRYAAWAKVTEPKEGEWAGKKYSEIRQYATLVVDVVAEAKEIPDLPESFSSFGAATVDGYVYVYGGHAGKTHSYANETTLGKFRRLKIDAPAKGWEELPTGTHLQGLALVGYKGTVIRIGGMEPRNSKTEKADNHSVTTVQRFDVKTLKWSDHPALPAGRSSHDAVVVGDTLVVVGGWNMKGSASKNEWHTTALTLDLADATAKWKSIEQPFSRRALTAAAHDGKVLVIAGMTAEGGMASAVNVLDPKTGKWTDGPQVPGEKMNAFSPASCTLDGKVYLNPSDGKVYRMNGEKWDEVSAIATPRKVHRMVPFGEGRALVLGGATGSGSTASCEPIGAK